MRRSGPSSIAICPKPGCTPSRQEPLRPARVIDMASARQSKAADRVQLANVINERLRLQLRVFRTAYQSSSMNYFVVDDLLGLQTASAIHDAFPGTSQMMLR